MTGDHLIWCTREEYAGQTVFDLNTSPVAYRHQLRGWCPCGRQHGEGYPRPEFPILRLVEAPASEADRALRHQVYTSLISHLELRADALADLTRRGLKQEHIDAVGYRSVPATHEARRRLVVALVGDFGEEQLRRVPGFLDRNEHLTFWVEDGYVVPYRDERRQITGVQCKCLLKGRYFTAAGSRVGQMYHVAGPTTPGRDVYITEGGLKAEVAAVHGNLTVVGVPGQTLTESHIAAVKRLRPGRVITALDWE